MCCVKTVHPTVPFLLSSSVTYRHDPGKSMQDHVKSSSALTGFLGVTEVRLISLSGGPGR